MQQPTLTTSACESGVVRVEAALVARLDIEVQVPAGWSPEQRDEAARDIVERSSAMATLRELTLSAARALEAETTCSLAVIRLIGDGEPELLVARGDLDA